VLLPTDEFDLVQRIENDHGVSTVPGLIAILRVRPDLLKSCSTNLLDWLSMIDDMPAENDNTTARLHVTTNEYKASKTTRRSASTRTRTCPHDTPATIAVTGTEIPSALALPVHGALPTGTTWRTAWARGDDLNLHPHAGMSLGELDDMGYSVATWRQREKHVDAHVVPEAKARFAPPHPDGTRGARADGSVVAEPVPTEVEGKPHVHIVTPMGIPLGTSMRMGMGIDMRMGGGDGTGLRMENLAAMLEAMTTPHSDGFGGLGMRGGIHTGLAAMRQGPVVFAVPQWRATSVRT